MKYAILDEKMMVYGVRATRELGEQRLRAIVAERLGTDPTPNEMAAFPRLEVCGVDETARTGSRYGGEVYRRRSRLTTKKAG